MRKLKFDTTDAVVLGSQILVISGALPNRLYVLCLGAVLILLAYVVSWVRPSNKILPILFAAAGFVVYVVSLAAII